MGFTKPLVLQGVEFQFFGVPPPKKPMNDQQKLGGGFEYFLFSPRNLGKISKTRKRRPPKNATKTPTRIAALLA